MAVLADFHKVLDVLGQFRVVCVCCGRVPRFVADHVEAPVVGVPGEGQVGGLLIQAHLRLDPGEGSFSILQLMLQQVAPHDANI